MSRIFLSHHNSNSREALALKLWLESQGWRDEIFLDFDPEAGIRTGTRWKDALVQAGSRCEAVVCLTSPDWVGSAECQTEYRTAENLGKKIFVAQLAEFDSSDKTREWQGCRLFGDGPVTEITLEPQQPPVRFLMDGLTRLRVGLLDAGISGVLPKHFPWPPDEESKREPYRGLKPLEFVDAGVYFGRDAEILRGLSELRLAGNTSVFVILGASGTGKSSFLRAGLLPRLKRDDVHFFPLGVVRPERSPLFGNSGMAQAIASVNNELNLQPLKAGQVEAELKKGPGALSVLLRRIQEAAHTRLVRPAEASAPPTLVLPVDQAEELFNGDATEEARTFLNLIGTILRGDPEVAGLQRVTMIVAFTIRSDRYGPLQTAAELNGIERVLFDDLRPMHPAQFKEVIIGPASRACINGRPLEMKPDLVNKLVSDCSTEADTLPLLGLILEPLFRKYGSHGELQLDEYFKMGALADVVRIEAESILSSDENMRKEQLVQLRAGFIPFLVTINRDNNQPIRRVAWMVDLPQYSRPLIQALIEKRLLVSDLRNNEQVVEVTHESLFRQWKVLSDWLDEERDDLKEADRLEEDAKAWTANGMKEEWLRRGERLSNGEALAAKPAYRRRLELVSEFLLASRQAEERQQQKEERVRQNELRAAQKLAQEQQQAAEKAKGDAERIRKGRRVLAIVSALLLVATGLASVFAWNFKHQFRQATALRVNDEARAIIRGVRPGGSVLGLEMMLAAHKIAPHTEIEGLLLAGVQDFQHDEKVIGTESLVLAIAFSRDGRKIVCGSRDQKLRLWNTQTGEMIGVPFGNHGNSIKSVAFSPDDTKVVSGSDDKALRLWDVRTGQQIGVPLQGHEREVWDVAFSPDGTKVVSASGDKTLRLWDVRTQRQIGAPFQGHDGAVGSVAFSSDGSKIISRSEDKTLRLWDVQTGQPIGKPFRGHQSWVKSVAFSPDGTKVVSGSGDMTVRLWDVQKGQPIGAPLSGHSGPVGSVSFSPDDTKVVSGSADKTLRLWNTQTGQPIGDPLVGHEAAVTSVAFSPDGTMVVSGGHDHMLRLWDVRTRQAIGTPLAGHRSSVTSVAFSPDGSTLASGSDDMTLRLWDVRTRQPIGAEISGHKSWVTSLAFSPDGTTIASASADKTVRLWPAPRVWPDLLCSKLARNMSRKEWREYVSPAIDYIEQCPGLPISPDELELQSLSANEKSGQ